jgi:YbbR domain-containing protein
MMKRLPEQIAGLRRLLRKGVADVARHWSLAVFSLAAAALLWAYVEQRQNPHTEAVVPLESSQPVPVIALNVTDGAILREQLTVRVRVDAREADVASLRASDFRASVDLRGVAPGELVSRPLRVESRRGGVRVLSVQPAQVDITLAVAATREMPVSVRLIGELPSGYRLREGVEPEIEPSIVKLRGPADLVDTIASIDVELSIGGLRDASVEVEGDLVARTAAGNRVDVTITPSRARASLRIEQTFSQRTLALTASVTGAPAPGYRITNISIDPPAATVAGPKTLVDFLQSLAIERVDVSGARTDLTQTKQIDRPANVTIDRQTVVVRVEVRPIECSALQPGPCGSMTIGVGPTFSDYPPGLAVDGSYQVQVRVAGPLASLALLKPGDLRATVSLAGLPVGTHTVGAQILLLPSSPPGLRAEAETIPVKVITVVIP